MSWASDIFPDQEVRHGDRQLLILFLAAVAVRVAYALVLYSTIGLPGITAEDSAGFLHLSSSFATAVADGTVSGWEWLGPTSSIMPLFLWILAGLHLLAGDDASWLFVMLNCAADAGTALVVVALAGRICSDFARAAGWFYALAPTPIIIAGIVFTDSLFVFLGVLSLWQFLRWVEDRNMASAASFGAALGFAAMVRSIMAPWAVAAFLAAGIIALLSRGKRVGSLGQLVAAGLIALVIVSPVLTRNLAKYDSLAFTSQTGRHLLFWVVPFVEQTATGAAWEANVARLRNIDEVREVEAQDNQFNVSAGLTAYAFKELRRLGLPNIAKTWGVGIAINLTVPAVSVAPPARSLPRPRYYGTVGQGVLGKIRNYVGAVIETLYGQLLILGFAGLLLFRLLQLVGLGTCYQAAKGTTLFLAAWCLYFLLISGPIASPKYRLPLEPVLAVFAGAGWKVIRQRQSQSKDRKASNVA